MSKVCDGLRRDAFVAAQEVGFGNLCEIVDGIPQGIDTLIQHMRGMVFPLTEHESKESFRQYCRSGGPFVQTKRRKYEAVCLEATALLDTLGSDGPSNPPQRRTPVGHVTGSDRFDTQRANHGTGFNQ